MRKLKNTAAFTLLEMIIVIAIVAIIAAVAFIAVPKYLRPLTKVEYDEYAKTIFVAAQNHLTAAQHEGYLGRTDFGTEEPADGVETPDGSSKIEGTGTGIFYIVVKDGDKVNDPDSVANAILPRGSVDEKIRSGSYIIRYHKDAAQVLDVFYWSTSERFKHEYAEAQYADFLRIRKNKEAQKSYTYTVTRSGPTSTPSVIGYYGGVEAKDLKPKTDPLFPPMIVVTNGDKLTVSVFDPNYSNTKAKIKLIVTGKTSGNSREIVLSQTPLGADSYDGTTHTYGVVLDSVVEDGYHFSQRFCQGTDPLIPGEDISIVAVSYNEEDYTNIAYSAEQSANSLFADTTDVAGKTAHVSNFRHLENLAQDVSGINLSGAAVQFTSAAQKTDLDWSSSTLKSSAIVSSTGTALTSAGNYFPVTPKYALAYDGEGHTVSGVKTSADKSADAGLFGTVTTGSSISNLLLKDFNINGSTSAGALAGTLTGTSTVTNVLAIGSSRGGTTVTATGSAGGLVGNSGSSTISKCAAAVSVSCTGGTAGGLVGTATAGKIEASYSSGLTSNASYLTDTAYTSVSGATVGGLVGAAGSAAINYSYSTASVSGTAAAGGFVGTASGTLTNCYSAGLVSGAAKGCFARTFSGTATGCNYFSIINDDTMNAASGTPIAGVVAFDQANGSNSAITMYETFVDASSRVTASPYDSTLIGYYQGKYNLRSVADLAGSNVTVASTDFVATHYGDWPAPELFFINTKV